MSSRHTSKSLINYVTHARMTQQNLFSEIFSMFYISLAFREKICKNLHSTATTIKQLPLFIEIHFKLNKQTLIF